MAIGAPQVGAFTERTAEASTAVPYPAAVNAGDLLVLMGSVFNAGLVTNPAGWTQVASFSSSSSSLSPDMFVAIKIAAGTEGGGTISVTHNNNVSAWQILALPGVDQSTPQDAAASTWDSTGDPVLPGITIATAGAALVYCAANVNTGNTATPPAGFTETGDLSSGTRTFTTGYKLGLSTGPSGTATVDFTGVGRSIGVMLALRPASAGSYNLAHIVETGTAWALTGKKTATLAHLVETDTAWPVTGTVLLPVPAGFPTALVECQFTPNVWTDITPSVNDADDLLSYTARGRPNEFTTTQPSILTLTLDNTTGDFTSGRSASPYYPWVTFGRPLRLTETFNGISRVRWTGKTNAFPTTWPSGPNQARARMTCTDQFKTFTRARKLRSVLQEETQAYGPAAYWPLGDPAGTTAASDVSGNQVPPLIIAQQGTGGTLTFASGTGPPTDGMSTPTFAPATLTNGPYLRATSTDLPTNAGVSTFGCWFTVPTAVQGATVMSVLFDDGHTYTQVYTDASGTLTAKSQAYDSTGGGHVLTATSPNVVSGGGLHHMAVVMTLSASAWAADLYVDGALAGSFAVADVWVATSITAVAIGGLGPIYGAPAGGLLTGSISHAAVWPGALTAGQIAAVYQAGMTGFAGETAGPRIARIARYADLIDPALLALDAGTSQIAVQDFSGGSPLDLMQEAATAEDGVLFMAGDGKLTFHARSRRLTSTSAFTLHGSQISSDFSFLEDDQFFVNDALYTRKNGSAQHVVNQTSIDTYGETYTDEQTLTLQTDNEVLDRANWVVNVAGARRSRCSQVKVDLIGQSVPTVAALLAAEISTRFTLDQLPSQAPAATVDLIIEGVAETMSRNEWSLTFTVSRAPSVGVFTIGSSLLGGPDVLGY